VVPSRVLRYAGLAVGAAAVVIALLPFTASRVDSVLMAHSTSCGPPIVEATRTPTTDGGWFGYSPLTGAPADFNRHVCYRPARHRLTVSAVLLFIAVLLGWASMRMDRPGRTYGRHRWRPHPA
jgi:hypothetical protein